METNNLHDEDVKAILNQRGIAVRMRASYVMADEHFFADAIAKYTDRINFIDSVMNTIFNIKVVS